MFEVEGEYLQLPLSGNDVGEIAIRLGTGLIILAPR